MDGPKVMQGSARLASASASAKKYLKVSSAPYSVRRTDSSVAYVLPSFLIVVNPFHNASLKIKSQATL